MTDDTHRDPQAPVPPDAMRDHLAAGAMHVGGATARPPGDTLPGAGLTDHDQPAEGGRDEAGEDEAVQDVQRPRPVGPADR